MRIHVDQSAELTPGNITSHVYDGGEAYIELGTRRIIGQGITIWVGQARRGPRRGGPGAAQARRGRLRARGRAGVPGRGRRCPVSPRGRHAAGGERPGDGDGYEQFRRDVFTESAMKDELAEELLLQIIDLEEVIAARWPRSDPPGTLAKDLRASVPHVQGPTFTDRRIETLGTGWLGRRP